MEFLAFKTKFGHSLLKPFSFLWNLLLLWAAFSSFQLANLGLWFAHPLQHHRLWLVSLFPHPCNSQPSVASQCLLPHTFLLVSCPHPYTVPAGTDQPAPSLHPDIFYGPTCLAFPGIAKSDLLNLGQGFCYVFIQLEIKTVLKLRPLFRNKINTPLQWQLSETYPFSPITTLLSWKINSLENVKASIICITKWLLWPVLRGDTNEPMLIPLYQDFGETEIQAHLYCLYYTKSSLIY